MIFAVRSQARNVAGVLLLVFVILLGGGFVGCAAPEATASDPEGFARVVRQVVGDYRPLVARLAVDLGYAPCRPPVPTRGAEAAAVHCSPAPRVDGRDWQRLRGLAPSAVPATTAPAEHAAGLWRLVFEQESPSWVERSVLTLRSAAAAAPENAAVLTDLDAALYLEATKGERPQSLVEAVELWLKAADLDPSRPEVFFDLALGYEALGLGQPAIAAWDRSLTLDSTSAWVAEARTRRQALAEILARTAPREILESATDAARVAELAAAHPEDVFTLLLEEWLPAYSEAVLDRDASRASALEERIVAGAAALLDEVGDATIEDALAEFEAARDVGTLDASLLDAVARGWVDFGRAVRLQRERDPVSAARLLEALNEASGTPPVLAAWVRLWSARLDVGANRYDEGRTALERLAASLDPARYPVLAARCA